LGKRLLNLNFDYISRVLRDGRHRKQVRRTHEEIAVEGGHAQAAGCAHARDGLKHDRHRKHFSKFVRELGSVLSACRVEGGVVVRLPGGVV
jgi:hypothetical protein